MTACYIQNYIFQRIIREYGADVIAFYVPGQFLTEDYYVAKERLHLLTGEPDSATAASGEVICACHAVGRETILAAICQQGLVNCQQIGEILKAGTGCDSCIPELKALLMATKGREVA